MAEPRTNGSTTTTRSTSKSKARATKSKQWIETTGARPARKLFKILPVARVIPQDVHSVMDYVSAAGCMSAAFFADKASAKVAAFGMGGTYAVTSALTDYRLSVAKVLPIEVHEVLDYVNGIGQIAAPFALGYWKKDRISSLIHIVGGATLILLSMFTDYRAQKGVTVGRANRA
jgi:hypothetical protein